MKTQELKKYVNENRQPLLAVGGALLLIIIAVAAVDLRQATLTLTVPQRGSAIIVDGKRADVSFRANHTVELSLAPGQHNIIVAAQDRYPWTKEITLSPNEQEHLIAFNLLEESRGLPVPEDEPIYGTLNSIPDTPVHFATSTDNAVSLAYTNGRLIARWLGDEHNIPSAFCVEGECKESIIVLESNRSIGDIGFLNAPGYIALYEAAGNIYAIELNAEGTQNFQPLFVGHSPRLVPSEEGVFVYDQEKLLRIVY